MGKLFIRCHLLKLIVLFLWLGLGRASGQKPLVTLELSGNKSDGSLLFSCSVENREQDTLLVLSQPFLLKGAGTHSDELHPWPGLQYVANVLYFEQHKVY